LNLFELTKTLVNIPSVTGSEGEIADFLIDYLRARAFKVRTQKIEGERRNIFAAPGEEPQIILCTHLDTVLGHFGAVEDAAYIYGRGACDAKGIMASMIFAAGELADEGLRNSGLLFVVGEETDSLGAKKADELKPRSAFIIVGEPTENKLGSGHKGLLNLKLSAKGRRAHSAFPHLGESATEKLLDVLHDIRRLDLGEDSVLGPNTLNIGKIEGGVAANVIPGSAEAVVSVRAATPTDIILKKILTAARQQVEIEVMTRSEAQILFTVPGFKKAVMPFATDIPYLKSFGKALLVGPGSILDAHTDDEKVEKKQLEEAVQIYKKLVRKLLKEN
jgi:acetylornithine deacetylase